MAVVLLGLFLAVVKPWAGADDAGSGAASGGTGGAARGGGSGGSGAVSDGAGDDGPTTSAITGANTRSPTPTPLDPTALARAAIDAECNQPSGWRLYDIDRWRGRPIHVWLAIDAVRATGPLDPAIEVLPLVATAIDALGFCAPVVGSVPSPRNDGSVRVWRLVPASGSTAARAFLLAPRRVSPTVGPSLETALGGLYAPAATGAADAGWPPGTYVFSVDGWWFGAEVRLVSDAGIPVSTPTPLP